MTTQSLPKACHGEPVEPRILPFSDAALTEALSVLHAGGTVAHATETCYGFACDLTNPAAVARLFAIKQRSADQPVSALFSSLEEAKQYVVWNARAEELARAHLPGPLTLILPMRADAPTALYTVPMNKLRAVTENCSLKTENSLGLRLSSHSVASALAAAFGSPLSTTSANLHGAPNPYSAADIALQFEGQPLQPDLILDSGNLPRTPPSTVIDLTKEVEKIHRKGDLTIG